MTSQSKIELSGPNYVPVINTSSTFYGGSQMWFPDEHWFHTDYIIHHYGCGTIAIADLFLYLTLSHSGFRSLETEVALRGRDQVFYENYISYVHMINQQYTKTKRFLSVFGTKLASVINEYSNSYGFDLKASWKFRLNYFDMLAIMEEMLSHDLPVIMAIGPNTPYLWGKKGIPFYHIREIDYLDDLLNSISGSTSLQENAPSDTSQSENQKPTPVKKPYYYKVVIPQVSGHYITVTGIIRDEIANRIMLRVSSWGKEYYINYEEYWDYVDNIGDSFTSGIVKIS